MKTFTAKLEGKQTKFEVDDNLTFSKVKAIIEQGISLDQRRGAQIKITELMTGLLSAVIVKPRQFSSPKYIDNISAFEIAGIIAEVQKIIPLERCLEALAPILGTAPPRVRRSRIRVVRTPVPLEAGRGRCDPRQDAYAHNEAEFRVDTRDHRQCGQEHTENIIV